MKRSVINWRLAFVCGVVQGTFLGGLLSSAAAQLEPIIYVQRQDVNTVRSAWVDGYWARVMKGTTAKEGAMMISEDWNYSVNPSKPGLRVTTWYRSSGPRWSVFQATRLRLFEFWPDWQDEAVIRLNPGLPDIEWGWKQFRIGADIINNRSEYRRADYSGSLALDNRGGKHRFQVEMWWTLERGTPIRKTQLVEAGQLAILEYRSKDFGDSERDLGLITLTSVSSYLR